MSFDVIYGKVTDSIKQSNFVGFVRKYFEQSGDDGTLYLGYSLTKDAEEMLTADALLIGKNCGVVAFSFPEPKDVQKIYDAQDALFYQLDFYFKRYPTLRKGRGLFFEFRVVSIVSAVDFEVDENYFVSTADNLPQFLSEGENLSEESYHRICEALQKVTGMKPAKERANVQNSDSMGGKLRELERQIANLDTWQQKAAMENVDGPQRIRGLAGSGKTIILAWKAAYLHAIHPDWDIAVTFFSRSLYQQFQELITRFYYLNSPNQLNWEKIQVLHSWGGWEKNGIYYKAARVAGVSPVNYNDAKLRYGRDGAFAGICKELNEKLTSENPLFDAVLIDEAQDLPESFFKIIYKLTKPPKRIIWAYDELQNIKNVAVPSAKVMFDISDEEAVNFSLDNIEDEATKDNILRVCYRNPKWSLAVAHALGFGIYRKPTGKQLSIINKEITDNFGIVQMFDEPEMWQDLGYNIIDGELSAGEEVTLKRSKYATPNYFEELLTPQDALQFKIFDSTADQYAWVAEEISKNITESELDADDILVIFAASNTMGVPAKYLNLKNFLDVKGIKSILATKDTFRETGKVTCSHIYRAKGNESPMVYVVNSENCAGKSIGIRNIIFTAITRSRAWVRILGVGESMKKLAEEINSCIENDYALKFKYPTPEELEKIRVLNFDSKKKRNKKNQRAKLIKLFKEGKISSEDLERDLDNLE